MVCISTYFLCCSIQLVEKLSAKAPDGQTKIKILSTIAKDHDIKWDPNSSEEQDPRLPEDLLVTSNHFKLVHTFLNVTLA